MRREDRGRAALMDAGLAALFLFAGIIAAQVQVTLSADAEPSFQPPPVAVLGTTVGLTSAPLAFRRICPEITLIAVAAGFVFGRLAGHPDVNVGLLAIQVAVYSCAAHGRSRRRNLVLAAVTLACLAELSVELTQSIEAYSGFVLAQVFDLAYNATVFVLPWALGASMRVIRARGDRLADYAAELERRRAEDAQRAVVDERVRIARELHDVVAHHVSVMGVQAGAARHVMDRDPAAAKAGLSAIEEASRRAVQELGRLLGFLRNHDDPQDEHTPPSLRNLEAMVASFAGTDLEVRLHRDGDLEDLPDVVDLAAYRIVQEGLTNVLRHARAKHALVRIARRDGVLDVSVTDDGHGRLAGQTGGHGHTGMQERARMAGGQFTAENVPGGGYRVTATFPMGAR